MAHAILPSSHSFVSCANCDKNLYVKTLKAHSDKYVFELCAINKTNEFSHKFLYEISTTWDEIY